jgi:hypothetical protein
LLSLSAAPAMGCHSYNIFHAFYSNLQKIILQTIKAPEAKSTKKSKAKHSDGEEDDEDDTMDTTPTIEEEEEGGNIDFEFTLSQGGRSQRNTRQQQVAKPIGQLSRPVFKDFTQTLAQQVEVMSYVKDEELLFSMADVLLNCLYLATIRSDLQRKSVVYFSCNLNSSEMII